MKEDNVEVVHIRGFHYNMYHIDVPYLSVIWDVTNTEIQTSIKRNIARLNSSTTTRPYPVRLKRITFLQKAQES